MINMYIYIYIYVYVYKYHILHIYIYVYTSSTGVARKRRECATRLRGDAEPSQLPPYSLSPSLVNFICK